MKNKKLTDAEKLKNRTRALGRVRAALREAKLKEGFLLDANEDMEEDIASATAALSKLEAQIADVTARTVSGVVQVVTAGYDDLTKRHLVQLMAHNDPGRVKESNGYFVVEVPPALATKLAERLYGDIPVRIVLNIPEDK